jgi:gamma-glutamylcyclotransferase (GGCT)/AIG2-like uncharacterized protein YtfP
MTLPGFRLYELGSSFPYPAAIRTSNIEDKIIVDIFNLSDTLFKNIEYMERDAGYHEDLVCINNEMHSIFLFNEDKIRLTNYISSGDWIMHFSKQDFIKSLKDLN